MYVGWPNRQTHVHHSADACNWKLLGDKTRRWPVYFQLQYAPAMNSPAFSSINQTSSGASVLLLVYFAIQSSHCICPCPPSPLFAVATWIVQHVNTLMIVLAVPSCVHPPAQGSSAIDYKQHIKYFILQKKHHMSEPVLHDVDSMERSTFL